jgi:hypothetical protein
VPAVGSIFVELFWSRSHKFRREVPVFFRRHFFGNAQMVFG